MIVKPTFFRPKIGTLSICFDDFPRNAWTTAGPLLKQHNVQATYFISGCFYNKWYEGIEYFTGQDLDELILAGHEVGCHTFDHVSALKVPLSFFKHSILRNLAFLNNFGITRPDSFAYPYNHVSIATKFFVASRFAVARSVGTTTNSNWSDLSAMRGINLSLVSQTGLVGSLSRVELLYLIERAALERESLIVYTHDVSDKPSEHGLHIADLERLIIRARQAGLAIIPVRELAPKKTTDTLGSGLVN